MITITILIIALFLSTFLYLNNQISEINKSFQRSENLPAFKEETVEETVIDKYTLKDYNNRLAIYKNDEIIEVLDIQTITLPKKDKQLLFQGIESSSKQELLEIASCYY